jgi:hypothetical protein
MVNGEKSKRQSGEMLDADMIICSSLGMNKNSRGEWISWLRRLRKKSKLIRRSRRLWVLMVA